MAETGHVKMCVGWKHTSPQLGLLRFYSEGERTEEAGIAKLPPAPHTKAFMNCGICEGRRAA